MNLSKGEKKKHTTFSTYKLQHSVICEKLDPKLALREDAQERGSFCTEFDEGGCEEPRLSEKFSF